MPDPLKRHTWIVQRSVATLNNQRCRSELFGDLTFTTSRKSDAHTVSERIYRSHL